MNSKKALQAASSSLSLLPRRERGGRSKRSPSWVQFGDVSGILGKQTLQKRSSWTEPMQCGGWAGHRSGEGAGWAV